MLYKIIGFIEPLYYLFNDYLFACIPRRRPTKTALLNAKVIAHRGVHDNRRVIENTLAAFQAALDHAIWGIEFDVRWTRDLIPMVTHDADCQRLFKKNIKVAECDYDELHKQCPQIPTLEEVVNRFGKRLHLMIELKQELYSQLELQRQKLAQVLSRLKPCIDYHIISLHPEMLRVPSFLPTEALFPIAVLSPKKTSQQALQNMYGGLLGHYTLISRRLIDRHHHHHQLLGTGHIQSKFCLFRELNRGIEWIFTNDAVKINNIIQHYSKT